MPTRWRGKREAWDVSNEENTPPSGRIRSLWAYKFRLVFGGWKAWSVFIPEFSYEHYPQSGHSFNRRNLASIDGMRIPLYRRPSRLPRHDMRFLTKHPDECYSIASLSFVTSSFCLVSPQKSHSDADYTSPSLGTIPDFVGCYQPASDI